jgi:hypothetical protein
MVSDFMKEDSSGSPPIHRIQTRDRELQPRQFTNLQHN